MKILIVSGFLGAGKTTFIEALARRTHRRFVIYENEYAGAGIDGRRLETGTDMDVWESTENCICCSGKADFATSILTISCGLDPDYLVVEPTGLAELGNILENVGQVLYEQISLLRPLTVVDAGACRRHHRRYREVYEDQICHAATVVITKGEQVLSDEVDAVVDEVRALNPTAEIVSCPYDRLPDEWFERLLEADLTAMCTRDAAPSAVAADPAALQMATSGEGAYEHASDERHDHHTHDGRGHGGHDDDDGHDDGHVHDDGTMARLALTRTSLPTPPHLMAILDGMSAGAFGSIVRAKGSLPCGNEWIRFDLVDGLWSITGDTPRESSDCVFIGEELRDDMITALLCQPS